MYIWQKCIVFLRNPRIESRRELLKEKQTAGWGHNGKGLTDNP